ncbi:MAG TPA: M14 family zinc carboxypeptidase, partial [Vicinamibacterales bacterium]|nr:M14 family zinc carboxypeptidase [Vicinamibacterales bacterium]
MSRSLLALAIVAALSVPGAAQQGPPTAPRVAPIIRPPQAAPAAPPPQPASVLDTLKTVAESSDYRTTSTYAEVLGFMTIVDNASPNIRVISYGTTYEGRMMPLAVVGTGLKDASAASVKASGKLRVHIQGNIHAGEVEGKEAALVLLREFAQGKHADWLETMVFLITPIFNADGNERFSLTNRGVQNGPINGQGTRANGQNININRDFMKLETPEGRAFAKLWNDYDPYVGMDLHTSDGSAHGYHLTYSPPLNPNTSAGIMSIMKDEWFPFVTK